MGVKPIRFQAIVMISLLFLMSTPIGQAEENQGNILDIEMGYWINENWIPLTTSFQFEFRLIDPWTGQVIYYEITNDTKIQIDLDDSKPIRPEIRSLENGINVQLLPTISPNSSVTTYVKANISNVFELSVDEIDTWKYIGEQTIGWINGTDSLTLPEGKGWIETRHVGEDNTISHNLLSVNCETNGDIDCGLTDLWPPSEGSLRIMAQDSGWNGTILVRHSPSGWEDKIVVNGTLDYDLPRIESGQWYLWRLINEIPESLPYSFDDALFESLDSWLSTDLSIPISLDSTMLLNFIEENPENNFQEYADWSASIRLPSHIGHPMFPSSNLGIMYQIDKFIGNWDGTVDAEESNLFSEILGSLGWKDAENIGCCSLNGEQMFATEPIYPTGGHIDPATGEVFADGISWGWDESGTLIGNVSVSSIQILKIPFRGYIRDSANLTIDLPNQWELRHSPQNDIIVSSGESIFINRSELSVIGEITLNLEENDIPIPSITSIGASESYVILNGNPSLNLSCEDSVEENTIERWKMTDKRGFSIVQGKYLNFSTDSNIFSEGDQIQIIGECIDSHGEVGAIQRNLILDGTSPEWDIIMLEDHPQYWAQINHSMTSSEIAVNATSTLIFDINTIDNNGETVSIIMTSNRSDGWIRESDDRLFFAEFWPQTDNVNGMHMSTEERHQERYPAKRWVYLSISDSVGNSVEKNWSFTSLDLGSPVPRPELLVNGEILGIDNLANTSSFIEIDLKNSFDDLNSIDNIIWTAELNGITLFENRSWEEISRFSLPALDSGIHDLVVSGIDLSGNIGRHSMIIEIHPTTLPTLSIEDIMVPTGVLSGQPGEITVIVFNHGSSSTDAEVCIKNECETIIVTGASLEGVGISSAILTFDSLPSGWSTVSVQWLVNDQPYFIEATTPSIEPAWRENARFLIKVVLIAYCLGTLFDRRFGNS
ncbi:MAG: hypothetical protein VX804_03525 [Candidatus Thermoplasmatota archaeon]|nr:hypothetical protein [Candidatus Thermoplasmatota archaeon]